MSATSDVAIAHLNAVYIRDGDWFVAWLEEMPGVITQGATLDEARANIRDALREMLAAQRELRQAELEGHTVVHREQLTIGA